MTITVIHGHQRTGKTVNGQAFLKQYGCLRIVEDWQPRRGGGLSLCNGDLVFTTESASVIAKHLPDARIVHINAAREGIGLQPAPASGFPIGKIKQEGLWYYASDPEAEYWLGGCETRDHAIDKGRAWAKGESFWIGLGTTPLNRLHIFDEAVTPVVLAFDDANEENYGEDGEGGPAHWDENACADLSRRLNAVFGAWAGEHGYERGWILDVTELAEIRPILKLTTAGAC